MVKTSDLVCMMSTLTLKWHEFEPHHVPFFRSDNLFVCVPVFFLGGGGGFLYKVGCCNFFGKLLPTEFLTKAAQHDLRSSSSFVPVLNF